MPGTNRQDASRTTSSTMPAASQHALTAASSPGCVGRRPGRGRAAGWLARLPADLPLARLATPIG